MVHLHLGTGTVCRKPGEQSRKHALVDEWKRLSNTGEGGGCATGLAVLAMEKAGASRHEDPLRQGVEWLKQHQAKDGSWWGAH
jgi:hypothetical protein